MLLNINRAIEGMNKRGLDAIIASNTESIQYLTDVPRLVGYAVLPRDKNLEPFLVTGIMRNGSVVDSDTWIKDIRYRGGAYYWVINPNGHVELTELEKKIKANVDSAVMDVIDPSPHLVRSPAMMDELKKGLQERGLEKRKLGIEEMGTTVTQFKKMEKLLNNSELVFTDDVFRYARQVKTEDEIKIFEESVPIVDEGWKAICEAAKPGITEGELLKEYKKAVVSCGHEGAGVDYNLSLGIGRRTIMVSSGTGTKRTQKLKKGDLIGFNGGIVYKNHPTHHARTAVLGEPDNPNVKKYYKAILEAEESGLEALRPGVKASEINRIMIDTVRKTIPYYQRHHTGHSLGIGAGYDTPNFIYNDHTPLEEGMVFNIEPSAFLEFGLGGLRLEDTLVITNNGYKLFTTTSRDLWQL